MAQYTVNPPNVLIHAGKRYEPGETVTLSEDVFSTIPAGVLSKSDDVSQEAREEVKAQVKFQKVAEDQLNDPGR